MQTPLQWPAGKNKSWASSSAARMLPPCRGPPPRHLVLVNGRLIEPAHVEQQTVVPRWLAAQLCPPDRIPT